MSRSFFWPVAQPNAVTGSKDKKHSGDLVLRRVRYALRFIYWTCKHGSTEHVRWVLAFEGYEWN